MEHGTWNMERTAGDARREGGGEGWRIGGREGVGEGCRVGGREVRNEGAVLEDPCVTCFSNGSRLINFVSFVCYHSTYIPSTILVVTANV